MKDLAMGQKPSTEFEARKTPSSERVTGRKARGPQGEEINCNCQTLKISVLSGRRNKL